MYRVHMCCTYSTLPLHRCVHCASELNGTSIVHEDVNSTKSLHGILDGFLDLSLFTDVDHAWQTLPPGLLHYRNQVREEEERCLLSNILLLLWMCLNWRCVYVYKSNWREKVEIQNPVSITNYLVNILRAIVSFAVYIVMPHTLIVVYCIHLK